MSCAAPEGLRAVNVTVRELPVLEALNNNTYPGERYTGFATLMHDTGIDRAEVRRCCRSLARKGLADYARALTDDDGRMAGAGYAITRLGRSTLSPSPGTAEGGGR